jgi:hypothetical protein
MDLWSRKIVGYHVGDMLETEGTLCALSMALSKLLPAISRSTIRTAAASIARVGMLKSFKHILLK